MKRKERDEARALRKKGMSMNDIVRKLGVSKASVSLWVRDIELTQTQRSRLTARGFSVSAIEKRRINRIANTNQRHQIIVDSARVQIQNLSFQEMLLVGTALYLGEGSKSNRNVASIANSDPHVIQIMMRFFTEICGIEREKFRAHVHTFSHLNVKRAEQYWSNISGIPPGQFYKTYAKPSRASKNKKDSLPYGTLQIYVCDTKVALSIKGWMDKLKEIGSIT